MVLSEHTNYTFNIHCIMVTLISLLTFLLCSLTLMLHLLTRQVDGAEPHIRERIVIDTDAGVDDAVAILALLGDPLLGQSIEGIICVRGNTETDNVAINVLKILKIAGRLEIPVYPGAAKGLLESPEIVDYYGNDGMGDANYPKAPSRDLLQKQHGAAFLASIVNDNPGEITLLCIGPMTNIALATRLNANFTSQVKRIIALGGLLKGNVGIKPMTEFNILMDPHAASVTMTELSQANQMLTLIPADTIRSYPIDKKWRTNILGSINHEKIKFLNKIENHELNKDGDRWMTYDVYAAMVLLRPEFVVRNETYYTNFETQGSMAKGIQIVDYGNFFKAQPNANIVFEVDKRVIKDTLLRNLS